MAKVFALLRDEKIYLKIGKKPEIFEFTFDGIEKYPNIPFYHLIYNEECIKQFEMFYKEKMAKLFNLVKNDIYVLLPPDGIQIDEMILKSFFLDVNLFSSVSFINEVFCMTSQKTFVCVSLTERMLVLDYFRDGGIKAEKCYYPLSYTKVDLKRLIEGLHEDCASIQMPIALNGSALSIYEDVGSLIGYESILDNAERIVNI